MSLSDRNGAAENISFFPKFAPASMEALSSSNSDLVNLNEIFSDQFFNGDIDTLDFLKDLSTDNKAFDMDELMDLGVPSALAVLLIDLLNS